MNFEFPPIHPLLTRCDREQSADPHPLGLTASETGEGGGAFTNIMLRGVGVSATVERVEVRLYRSRHKRNGA
jgi:hypothetical protein